MKAGVLEFSNLYTGSGKTKKNRKRSMAPVESDDRPTVASTPQSRKSSKHNICLVKSDTPDEPTPDGIKKPKKHSKSVDLQLDESEVKVKKNKRSKVYDTQPDVSLPSPHTIKKHKHYSEKIEIEQITGESSKKKNRKPKFQSKSNCNDSLTLIKKDKSNIDATEKRPKQASTFKVVSLKQKKKKLSSCDRIKKDFKKLEIGDNASSLVNLLEDVQLAKKLKKKKLKKMHKKEENVIDVEVTTTELENTIKKQESTKIGKKKNKLKKPKADGILEPATQETDASDAKEKVKWSKRKWNKDGRSLDPAHLATCILLDNVPFAALTTYKKELPAHFGKYGQVKKVGVAEMYPSVEHRQVFTTTLQFLDQAAAKQALEEDNTEVCGGRVRVRQPLPPTLTTVVVRCYAGCSPHLLSSVFAPCGRVRSIREILKGKSSIPTAFVEFDGPTGVEQALKLAAEVKVGGKKIFVSRFEEEHGSKRKRVESSLETDEDP